MKTHVFLQLHILFSTLQFLFSLFICNLSHFIAYLMTSYAIFHYSYLDEPSLFIFIFSWTDPVKYHTLFIILHMFMNIKQKTSYAHEHSLTVLISYLSYFSSYLTWTSYLDEHSISKFIVYFTTSVLIYHSS